MWQSQEVRFASDHPTAPGHFPSRPIIPGVLLLDEAIKLAEKTVGAGEEIVVRAAKFHHPVQPGETIVVRWDAEPTSIVKFECWLRDKNILVASGTFVIVPEPK
jgi:3-hydroxymyristoyl/3-hydroxydecanoyl-(acyl carrier protein) dehydratase